MERGQDRVFSKSVTWFFARRVNLISNKAVGRHLESLITSLL